MNAPVVEISHLTKRYGEFTALDDLSLSLNRGSILGFIGPNGAGKTTTIRILVGLSRATSGTATIAGEDCLANPKRIRELVGYMPDKFGSYDNMRVREYLDFFGAAYGIKRRERAGRIGEVLELTNATWMKDRYVESLSHGMQQRVGLARTLLHQPEVLILDEPANGLDPQARIEMRDVLLRLADEGRTLIVTSHILPELSRICNQVAIIAGGKLRACGTLSEVTKQLSQERTIEVLLLTEDACSKAADVCRKLLPDAQVTVSETEQTVRLRTKAEEEQLTQLLTGLVQASVPVSQLREVAGDLEEAFLSATEQARADASETATAKTDKPAVTAGDDS